MSGDELPIYRRLSFKFLASTAAFIIIIELILLVFSLYGMENRLHYIRQTVHDSILTLLPEGSSLNPSDILSHQQIEKILYRYFWNIILMVLLIVVLVVSGLYFVVNYLFISPLQHLLEKNEQTMEDNTMALIDEENIPQNEIGLIMKSRNEMLNTINTLYNEQALETLREAVDAKDEYTEGHSRRVGELGALLGEKMGLSDGECEQLEHSGLLHDVGKIGVDDSILTKPGSLTDEEFEEIMTHPVRGEKIIQFSSIADSVLEGVRHHHEQFDGSGYPDELAGDEIPLFGRVLAVADAMDAMLSNRHYRDALSWEEVHEELKTNRENQFDPDIADYAIELIQPENRNILPEFS